MSNILYYNRSKFATLLGISIVTGLTATACNFKVSTAGLENVKMCAEVAQSGQCASDTVTFDRNTGKLFVTADLNNAPEGTKVKIDWKYLGGEAGNASNIDTVTVESKPDTSFISSNLTSNNKAFPAGKYEVVLALDTDNSKPIRKEFSIAN